MKLLNHQNIVKLIDVFEDETNYSLVMELMEGGQLYNLIQEKERFSEDEAKLVIKILIDALNFCHSYGILHRDIKP